MAEAEAEAELDYLVPPTGTTADDAVTTAAPVALILDAFDGVRGIGSVVIVVGHVLFYWTPMWDTTGNTFGQRWPTFGLEFLSTVSVFVILSGFCLTVAHDDGATCFWPFMLKRFTRLAPIYYTGVALGLAPLIVYCPPVPAALALLNTVLGLQSLFIFIPNWVDGPLWTVSALLLCYMLFPSMHASMIKRSTASLCAVFCGCTVANWVLIFWPLFSWTSASLLHILAPFRVAQFALGMSAAMLARRVAMPHATVVAEVLSLLLGASMVFCALLTGPFDLQTWMTYSYTAEWLLPPVHAIWLAALASPTCSGPTRLLLSSRPMRMLGAISFALYSLHFPTLFWCAWAVRAKGITAQAVPQRIQWGGWYVFPPWAIIPLLAVCLAVAAAAHALIEKPAVKLLAKLGGFRLSERQKAAADPTGVAAPSDAE